MSSVEINTNPKLTGAGASWFIQNAWGTTNGEPTGGVGRAKPGLAVGEAELNPQVDALDGGMSLYVNNQIFVASDTVDVTGQTLTTGLVPLSGLDVRMQYYADTNQPVLRSFVSFTNPTASAITVSISWVTNVGSDENTAYRATSSGDTVSGVDDRWLITDDHVVTDDPAVTHVLYGPGNPTIKPVAVSDTTFLFGSTEGVVAQYSITIPAQTTRSLLFFNGLSETSDRAISTAPIYDSIASLQSSTLLSGLNEQQLAETLNWQFQPPVNSSTVSPVISGSTNSGNANDAGVARPRRLVVGGAGADVLRGDAGNDAIVGGVSGDILTGGAGADHFVYAGRTRQAALSTSRVSVARTRTRVTDEITDFDSVEGDRIQLDFDNNLNTSDRPTQVYHVGRVRRTIETTNALPRRVRQPVEAIQTAYDDTNVVKRGRQAIRPNEAIIVRFGSRTYLSVNDNQAAFNPQRDLVIDVTGARFSQAQNSLLGVVPVNSIFV